MKGGFLVTVGFLLSPLSWWNDLLINIPLVYGFGFLFGLISKKLFPVFMVIGYWLTNVLGFVLMHKGVGDVLGKEEKKGKKKELLRDIAFGSLYTLLIVVLIWLKILKFPTEYLNR